ATASWACSWWRCVMRRGGVVNVTREEIMQLTGRELDAAVAERVMGLRPCRFRETGRISGLATMWQCEHGTRRTCYPVNQDAVDHPHSPLHHYSTNIAAAWEVVEHLATPDEALMITYAKGTWVVAVGSVEVSA